jgi:hypothetical protein
VEDAFPKACPPPGAQVSPARISNTTLRSAHRRAVLGLRPSHQQRFWATKHSFRVYVGASRC